MCKRKYKYKQLKGIVGAMVGKVSRRAHRQSVWARAREATIGQVCCVQPLKPSAPVKRYASVTAIRQWQWHWQCGRGGGVRTTAARDNSQHTIKPTIYNIRKYVLTYKWLQQHTILLIFSLGMTFSVRALLCGWLNALPHYSGFCWCLRRIVVKGNAVDLGLWCRGVRCLLSVSVTLGWQFCSFTVACPRLPSTQTRNSWN